MSLTTLAAAFTLAACLALPALAEGTGPGSMYHGSPGAANPAGHNSPSSKAFAEANARMHEGMDIRFTGNADVDFVRGMIAHHQGAIDMAKIELEHGKDETIRKLADDIIRAQEAEIKMMREWLTRNGG
jgi:uncharacterized protein (DUF305 family)